ncbi:MAG: hypothetical protein HN509_15875 [Halobacteriovoraceae bacterium]|jgi:hypothetical protein|nr:hypothetical protein [Halobacteriovoraceae bacterium]MBT5094309.1 hypothetical protein [Halobacteriovoraceae bacterium]
MNKLLIIGFGIIFSCQALASGQNSFGLSYSGKEKAEFHQVNHFLRNLERDLSAGIRFGVDRRIEIDFEDFQQSAEFQPQCQKKNSDNYIRRAGPQKLVFNKLLLAKILKRQTRDRVANCSHRQGLLVALTGQLLQLEGADDLARKLSYKELQDISYCRDQKRRKGIIAHRFAPKTKELCKQLAELEKRRRRFEYYQYRVKNQLYKVHLEFDPTHLTDKTLEQYAICERPYRPTKIMKSGKRLKVLGMAIIYMAPGFSTSVAGHVAERYVYCLENKLMDIMFEYTQMTSGELENMKSVYSKYLDGITDEYVQRQKSKIYMKVRTNPASTNMEGYGFLAFHTNRDLIEIWPKASEEAIYSGLQDSLKHYKKQKQNFIERKDFEVYSLLHNNCTHPVRERLNHFAGEYKISDMKGFYPPYIFGFLKKKNAEKMIIYPSQRTLRKLRMLEKGHGLFWENTTFWSRASEGKKGAGQGWMLLYPESHGLIKSLIVNSSYGAINLGAAIAETLYGLVTTPIRWLASLFGFKKFKVDKKQHLANGIKGIGMSLTEILGLRMRYPRATNWNEEELNYIHEELIYQEPRILDHLMLKVQQ